MLACSKSHTEIVKMLVESGAKVSRANKDGWNAFHIAARLVVDIFVFSVIQNHVLDIYH